MMQTASIPLTVPPPEELDPVPGRLYWDHADLRVVLELTGGPPTVEVRQPDGRVDAVASATLAGCGSTGRSNTFYNNREGADIQMLEVDMRSLLDCIHDSGLIALKDVDDATDGGLVLVPRSRWPEFERGQQLRRARTQRRRAGRERCDGARGSRR